MDLVEVRFPSQDKFVFVPPGTTLLAAAELAGAELATGCRRGQCWTDAVRVACDPADALAAAAEPESGTLHRMGVGADCRLACSARVQRGSVQVLGDALL